MYLETRFAMNPQSAGYKLQQPSSELGAIAPKNPTVTTDAGEASLQKDKGYTVVTHGMGVDECVAGGVGFRWVRGDNQRCKANGMDYQVYSRQSRNCY